MQVWIEAASGRNDHGGKGWELGRCIWSPAHDRLGRTQKYRVMNWPSVGDPVVNCSAGIVLGVSRVCRPVEITSAGPPNPGPWGYARSFYRLSLNQYAEFESRVALNAIAKQFLNPLREDIERNRPKYFLFSLYPPSERHPTGKLVLAQGRFLARSTSALNACLAASLPMKDRALLESRFPKT